jgi:hypothetical protein
MSEIYPFSHSADQYQYTIPVKQFATLISPASLKHYYDHRFTQVNSPGRAATNCVSDRTANGSIPTFAYYESTTMVLKPRDITTYLAQSVVSGYKLHRDYIEYIEQFYKNEPFVVPAEIIFSDNMGAVPSLTGIDATKQFKFTHVKEMCVLFPRRVSDYTVQFNPCLEKLSVSMFNHDYPEKETDTTSARFLRSQLETMGLDTVLQCTESLEQSITSPPSYLRPVRDRSMSDNTDFIFVIPLERASANAFFFDGKDSGADTETVTISGKFIRDKNGQTIDTYALLNRHDDAVNEASYNRTPPIVALVSDTFWLFTSHNGGVVEYNTKESWIELFEKRFPALAQKLARDYMARF